MGFKIESDLRLSNPSKHYSLAMWLAAVVLLAVPFKGEVLENQSN